MRILHLVSYAVFSGPLPPTLQLAQAQVRAGHKVWLAYDTLRGPFSPYEEAAAPRIPSSLAPPGVLGLSPKAGLRQLWRDRAELRRLAEELRLDVIHSHLSHDHALVAMTKLPGVLRVHTVHSRRPLGRAWARRWLWRHTDAVILRSDADVSLFLKTAPRFRGSTRKIEGSIDTTFWRRVAPEDALRWRKMWHVPAAAPLFLHVALMAGRGQQELLEAWADCFQTTCFQKAADPPVLAFVGDGPDRPRLEAMAVKRSIQAHVRFVGYQDQAALVAAYTAAQGAFLAQPGNDASARAALEAIALEVPLILLTSEADNALSEIAQDNRAMSVATRTPEAIRKALQQWFRANGNSRFEGKRARKWAMTDRHPDREAALVLKLYEEQGK